MSKDDDLAITCGPLTGRMRAWNEPDPELSIELERGQWLDVLRALKMAHESHDDDGQDSKYNGEYDSIAEWIKSALGQEDGG